MVNNKKEEKKQGFSLAITSYKPRQTMHTVFRTRFVKEKKKKKKKEDSAKNSARCEAVNLQTCTRESSNYPRLIKMYAFGRD